MVGCIIFFPLDIFNEDDCNKTLGINFIYHKLIQDKSLDDQPAEKFTWKTYLLSLFNSTFVAQYDKYKSYEYNKRIITINTLGINPLNFNLTNKQKEILFEEGYNSTIQWYDRLPKP